jgi:hypothetical protein
MKLWLDGGRFRMGSENYPQERPVRQVDVDGS